MIFLSSVWKTGFREDDGILKDGALQDWLPGRPNTELMTSKNHRPFSKTEHGKPASNTHASQGSIEENKTMLQGT